MVFRMCACGCGKYFPLTTHNKKYYNSAHKLRANRMKRKGLTVINTIDVNWDRLSPKERFDTMTLSEVAAECLRLHISYGKASMLAESGRLPKDFGKGLRK